MATGEVSSEEVVLELPVYRLDLNEPELELIHNLLHAGPRLGFTPFREIAGQLLEMLDDLRGQIEYEDRLFDFTDKNGDSGLEWVREVPYPVEFEYLS